MNTDDTVKTSNFIKAAIDEDLARGLNHGVVTRFPPEPNGYLHIGHAKSICLNFGLARAYQGRCHLRFDDTNPAREDQEYVESIMEDARWLGADWGENLFYASDYFARLYEGAVCLIKSGDAYVCDLSAEEVRAYRGTLTEPGRDSPFRGRTVAENLDLFAQMRAGEFADGAKTLRAKIDMASPNINMRDPALYRIRRARHHRTDETWPIYPMYDYAHSVSDAIEGITHSLCTLEFEDHRPLYNWVLEKLNWPRPRPRQIEFARLNLEYALMSKRKLLRLVQEGHVSGWDDPRMTTVSGLRRRGFTPESIRLFCDRIGVAKKDSWIEMDWLEKAARDDLNPRTPRVMAVLRPLKVVIENWPEGQEELIEAPYFPDEPGRMGSRQLVMARQVYIEQDDFRLEPPKKYYRLAPGREVRLRWAYYIHCHEVKTDAQGRPAELRCTYSEEPRGLGAGAGKKPAIIHWTPAAASVPAEVRLYDRLFTVAQPGLDLESELNPHSLAVISEARLEPSLAGAGAGQRFQFERLGYFMADLKDHRPGRPVFNRIVTLKDSWAKEQSKAAAGR